MKVFNLACGLDHRFEGWFASSDAFDEQLARGLIHCPMCDATSVRRMPTAPRLNLSSSGTRPASRSRDRSREASQEPAGEGAGEHAGPRDAERVPEGASAGQATAMPTPAQLQALWLRAARHLVRNTENVGERFAEEARRIHYNEAPERGIRGVTTSEERAQLEEEGIDVFSFPMPEAVDEPLQ